VFSALSGYVGSSYGTQCNKFGLTFQVYAQAASDYRVRPDDILNLKVKAGDGTMVPLVTVVDVTTTQGPSLISLYNLYPSATIFGGPAAGVRSGQSRDVMEQIA
ncbi:efflux RND transporter permease subunit, partial [Rhizobium ruizarguesonis]